jgi:hypothetical protein
MFEQRLIGAMDSDSGGGVDRFKGSFCKMARRLDWNKARFKKIKYPNEFETTVSKIFTPSSKKSRFNHNKCESLTFMFVEMISNGDMPETTRDYVRGVSRYYVRNSGITDNQFSAIKKIFQQTVKDQNWLEKYEAQLKQVEIKRKLREQLHSSKAH